MNTRNLISILYVLLFFLSCKKTTEVTYRVNDVNVMESKASKFKAKNEAEYISILYTNIFQTAISPSQLYQSQNVLYSIGDQTCAKEMLLSNYFNSPFIKIPKDDILTTNPEQFIKDTYKRFYLRNPSEAEMNYFKNYIQSHPLLTVEMVYTAFACSDEYGYY